MTDFIQDDELCEKADRADYRQRGAENRHSRSVPLVVRAGNVGVGPLSSTSSPVEVGGVPNVKAEMSSVFLLST